MFLEIPDLLTGQEVAVLRTIAAKARFDDGRLSSPHAKAKHNLQQDLQDPSYRESSPLLQAALARNEHLMNFVAPKMISPPLLTKHEVGMAYGAHSDAAYMMVGQAMLRSDLSCTIFLSDPGGYAGGELCIHLGTKPVFFKLPPGGAVIYPSTTLHEVRPVTAGVRLVAITFMESRISNPIHRELIYELGEVAALEGFNMWWENRVRLLGVIQNLQRLWS